MSYRDSNLLWSVITRSWSQKESPPLHFLHAHTFPYDIQRFINGAKIPYTQDIFSPKSEVRTFSGTATSTYRIS